MATFLYHARTRSAIPPARDFVFDEHFPMFPQAEACCGHVMHSYYSFLIILNMPHFFNALKFLYSARFLGAEIHYSAIQPDDAGQTWLFRIYAVPVVPSPFAG